MSTQSPKISIIVPVYKVEQYLPKCIDSILAQTYPNWELLLIDDGSPDNSGKICDEYAQKDERIRVFHKENGGVSSARNLGLDNADGDYVMFVDSDDWISNECLCKTVNKLNSAEVLQFGFTRYEQDVNKSNGNKDATLSVDEFLSTRVINVCVWGNLIKNTIIQKYNIRFDEILKLGEDQLFIFQCIACSKLISRINLQLYYYRDNPESAMHNEKVVDMINSCWKCIEFKRYYPEFAFRIDDLVLYYLEKMILAGHLGVSSEILKALTPKYINLRPTPIKMIVTCSRINVTASIRLGWVMLKCYHLILKFYIKSKNIFKNAKS